MGDVIQMATWGPEPTKACGHCGQFALSNNGVSYCLYWQEPVDFGAICERFEWPA